MDVVNDSNYWIFAGSPWMSDCTLLSSIFAQLDLRAKCTTKRNYYSFKC